jgi:outer membrane protein
MKMTYLCFFATLVAAPVLAEEPDAPAPAAAGTATPTAPPKPTFSLGLDQSVKMALENNPDIMVEKLGPEAGREGVTLAAGAYDPLLAANVLRTAAVQPSTNILTGGTRISQNAFVYNGSLSKLFATGGSATLSFTNTRSTTNSTIASFSPLFQSGLSLSVTQPLLRNFFNDASREQLKVAKNNQTISDAQFAQIVANTIATAKQQYYELIYSIDNLDAARRSLDLAKQLLSENRIRVRVGTLAPLDVVQAQSEAAGREGDVIVAEAALADAEDALRRTILPRTQPELWALQIAPTDHPGTERTSVDVDKAIQVALKNRTDMTVARKTLESQQIAASYAAGQTRPQLDLVASYAYNGVGGTEYQRNTFGGPVVAVIPGGYSDALSAITGRDFPTWTAGVNFSYPILNRAASARAAIARITRDQAEASLRRLQIDVEVQVRKAVRAVESNYKSVEATQAARILQEQRLDAENKKFAAGMSTNFLVTSAQRDLATARVLELRSIANYNESLVTLDLVQQANPSGITIVGGGSGLSTSGTATTSTTPKATTSGTSTTAAPGSSTTVPPSTTTP